MKVSDINKKSKTLLQAERYFSRDLSWLEFNARVLQEAIDPNTPLLDRLKFLAIFSTNLDEFFMVRVAGLKKMAQEGIFHVDSPDALLVNDVLEQISWRVRELVALQYKILTSELYPLLRKNQIEVLVFEQLSKTEKQAMKQHFFEQVFPVLTPLAVDPSHPHPFLTNLSVYFLVECCPENSISQDSLIGFVEIPRAIDSLVPLAGNGARGGAPARYLALDSLIKSQLEQLFLGFSVKDSWMVRVTRNLDYKLLESDVVDLLESIRQEVVNKIRPEAVRLEISQGTPPPMVEQMMELLRLSSQDIYELPDLIDPQSLMQLYALGAPGLKERAFNPRLPRRMGGKENLFSLIREKDLLVHHPFESFCAVTEFLRLAAGDPSVYAIKLTLYRSSGDSPIIEALIKAAQNRKQVTVVVELKARFDEHNNIVWATRLERAGVNVVYGFVGLKTHAKMALIVRKEKLELRRYVHLSTGNYNSTTAHFYTDVGFFTANPSMGQDVSSIFNFLTGFNFLTSKNSAMSQPKYGPLLKKLTLAPINLRETLLDLIDSVIQESPTREGLITIKINGLDDKILIDKLYEASQAGVAVRLIVRGLCCLKPGVVGLSENIRVISVLDRFLEHSRIFHFKSGSQEQVFLSSADWMTRNMERRIEVMFPIEDLELKSRLFEEILGTYLNDSTKARELKSDGRYEHVVNSSPAPIRAQSRLIGLAREDGIKSIPYHKAIRFNPTSPDLRPVARKSKKTLNP